MKRLLSWVVLTGMISWGAGAAFTLELPVRPEPLTVPLPPDAPAVNAVDPETRA